jgi:hypothetical protein
MSTLDDIARHAQEWAQSGADGHAIKSISPVGRSLA